MSNQLIPMDKEVNMNESISIEKCKLDRHPAPRPIRSLVLWLFIPILILPLAGCREKDVSRSYYSSGKLKTEAEVKNGLLDVHAVMYFENGTKMSEAQYRLGVLVGKSIAYYESGGKKAEATYSEGVLNGISVSWNESGQKVDEVVIIKGLLQPKNNQVSP